MEIPHRSLPAELDADVAAVALVNAVPQILDVVCRVTGMGFAAVARVTDEHWVACAVRDDIAFGLPVGGELDLRTTLCHEVRQANALVVIDHVAADPTYCGHHTPAQYGFQSYISVPIRRADGSFFGTLCAIDPQPRSLNRPDIVGMFTLFADLIASQLDAQHRLSVMATQRAQFARLESRQRFLLALGDRLRALSDPGDIQYEAARALGDHLGANRVGYAEDLGDGERVAVRRDHTRHGGSLAGIYRYEDYGLELVRELRAGRAVARDNIPTDDSLTDAERAAHAVLDLGATLNVPIVKDGALRSILFVHHRAAHTWTDEEVELTREVAERTWAAVESERLAREIRASDERARLALEGAELGSWDVDLATGQAVWSRRHAEMQGHQPAALHSLESWRELVHPDDLEDVLSAMTRARDTQTAFAIEHRLRRADTNEERWLALYGRYSYDQAGTAVRVSGVSRDVTERRRAEDAQQQFVRLADEAADFIGMATPDGQAVYVNRAGRALLGLHEADVPGTRIADYVPDADREWFTATVLRHVHATGRWEGEARLRHVRTDEPIDVLQKVFTIRDPKTNAPVRLATTALDIRDRKRAAAELAASEAKFRQLADQTPMVMWVTDARGGVEFVNQAYCVFFGVTLDEVRGPNWRPLLHPEDGAYIVAFEQALAAGRPFHATARVRRADGEWRWIASVGHPRVAADGTVVGMIGVSPDVTDQRQASELQHEAARQKDEFIAVLAHELRNPLAPIRTSMGVLRACGTADPTLMKCRDVIDRQVTHMARLLDDLLDVSRLSRGKLTLQRTTVRLRDVVDVAIETVRPMVDNRRHTLTVETIAPSVVLDADSARVTQILVNLLSNASKYTEPGGLIALSVDARDDAVVITVKDNGIGLRPESRERIFDLFTQVEDARHREDGGLGIGLGLTKRLVEMHGGTIAAESPGPNQGSTFSVTLPTHVGAPSPETGGVSALWAAPVGVRRRVLIVDDNADAADTLAMLLETLGCDTRTVYDGESALREARTFLPDLVLLDLGMPGLDGVAVCHRVRQETWGTNIVIAAVTGWGQEEDRRRTRVSGFDHHLVKPVDPRVLAQLVAGLPQQRIM